MRVFLVPALLIAFAFASAQDPKMSTYHNDTLHLSYAYPSDYIDATQMVGPAFQASMGGADEAAVRCISLPFSRMQAGTGNIGMLMLVRADAGCLKKKFTDKSVSEIAQGEAQGLAASGAKTNFGKPVTFQVANRPAAMLQGSFTLPTGQGMQAMVVCVLDEPDMACWQFLSNSTQGLSKMASFPVTFDGASPTPLVPSDVLTKP